MDFQFVRKIFWKNFNLLRIQDIFLKIMDSIKFYGLNNQFLMDFYFWKSVFSWISCLGYLNLIGIPFWEMYFLMNFPIRVFEFQWISNFWTRYSIDWWLVETHFQWISYFGNIHIQSISSTGNCQNCLHDDEDIVFDDDDKNSKWPILKLQPQDCAWWQI